MSKANVHRLFSEVIALFDGSQTLAAQALIALLARGHVLLSPRGHHFENLANALAWSFNGILKRIGPFGSIEPSAILDNRQLPHVLLVENIDTDRLKKLQETLEKISSSQGNKAGRVLVVATADPVVLPRLFTPDRAAWDAFFTMRLNGREPGSEEHLSYEIEPDSLGVEQILPEDVEQLQCMVEDIEIPEPIEDALVQLPELLQEAGWAGASDQAMQCLQSTAKAVAFLRGKSAVNASHIAEMLHPVLSSRLTHEDAPPQDMLDAVEETWDELVRQVAAPNSFVPQRKTFVGFIDTAESKSKFPDFDADKTNPFLRAPAAEPLSLHSAYSRPAQPYQRLEHQELTQEEKEEEEQEALQDQQAAEALKSNMPRSGLLKAILVGMLFVVVLILGTLAFPTWPATGKGVLLAFQAEWERFNNLPEAAMETATQAQTLLGHFPVLEGRLDGIQYWARTELGAKSRTILEKEAKLAFSLERYEEAARLYDELGLSFPEYLPLYSEFAKAARERLSRKANEP